MGDLKHSDHSFVKKKKHFFSSTQKHTASVKGSREDGGEKKQKRLFFRKKKKNENRGEKERKQEKKKDRKYSISLALSQLAPSPLNSRYLFLTEKIKRVSQEKKEIYNLKNSFIFFRAAPS